MSAPPEAMWQINALGNFENLRQWARAQDDQDDPSWLALSVFEEALPEGRLQLLFEDEDSARAFARNNPLGAGFRLDCQALLNENWIVRSLQGLPVVRAGRFYLHGAHHPVPNSAAMVPVLIEAGEAFGTGHHGTTKGCLLAFEDVLCAASPARVLDLGTGAGTLAIAVAKVLPEAEILATDIDPVAVAVARANAGINGVGSRVGFVVADGFSHHALQEQSFDLILANILANPLVVLAPHIAAALASSATLILSGILDCQAARVRAAYEAQDVEFMREYESDEWRILVMKAPT